MTQSKNVTLCSIVVILLLIFQVSSSTAQYQYGGSPPYSFGIPEKIYSGFGTQGFGDSFFAYDLDGDGDIDFCFRSETTLYAYEHNGTQMWSAKIRQPGGNGGTKHAAGDIDGDGDVEVLAISNTGYIHIYDGATGTDLDSIQVTLHESQRMGHIALARLQKDGSLDAIIQTLDVINEKEGDGYEYFINRSLIAIDLATKNEIWRVDQDRNITDGIIYTDNSTEGYWGCAHNSFVCADIDGDSLDEVVGGNAIDDDGSIIDIGYDESDWVSRWDYFIDHLDAIAVGDFLPDSTGLEWCFLEEDKTEWSRWGAILANEEGVIWRRETSLFSEGYHNNDREPQAVAVGNFSNSYPGCEFFIRSRFGDEAQDQGYGQHPWIFTSDGTMPFGWNYDMEDVLPAGFNPGGNANGLEAVWTIDWDNSGIEYIAGKARHAYGNVGVFNAINGDNIWVTSGLDARMIYVADVQGDSREEIVVYDSTSAGYTIKIYWNTDINLNPLHSKWVDPLYTKLKQNWNYYSPGSYTARDLSGFYQPISPKAVDNFNIQREGNAPFLEWSSVRKNIQDEYIYISRYEVGYSADPSFPSGTTYMITGISDTSYIDSGIDFVSNPQTRFYRVRAVDTDGLQSDWSDTVGVFNNDLITTSGTDFNEVCLILADNSLQTASDLLAAVPHCSSVARWNATSQGYDHYVPALPQTNYQIESGHPYLVNVTQSGSFPVFGSPTTPVFTLMTTATTDFNAIIIPLDKKDITTASALQSDISNCNSVARWKSDVQGFEQYVSGLSFTDFPVEPGHAYYVNVTAPTTWPTGGTGKSLPAPRISAGSGRSKAPHLIWGEIVQENASQAPGQLRMVAYLHSRPSEKLTASSPGCFLDKSVWTVQCGSFPSGWQAGDTLMVEISSGEDTSKSSTFVLLNNDPTGKAEALVMSQPVHLQLGQNYPNPFNASTRIQFQLDHNEMVELSVFDCTGRKIRTLLHSSKEAGEYSVLWKGVDDSGRTVASGVYIILLRIGQNERRVRTVLLR